MFHLPSLSRRYHRDSLPTARHAPPPPGNSAGTRKSSPYHRYKLSVAHSATATPADPSRNILSEAAIAKIVHHSPSSAPSHFSLPQIHRTTNPSPIRKKHRSRAVAISTHVENDSTSTITTTSLIFASTEAPRSPIRIESRIGFDQKTFDS